MARRPRWREAAVRDGGRVRGRVREEPACLPHFFVFRDVALYKRLDEQMVDHKEADCGEAKVDCVTEERVVVEHDLRHGGAKILDLCLGFDDRLWRRRCRGQVGPSGPGDFVTADSTFGQKH